MTHTTMTLQKVQEKLFYGDYDLSYYIFKDDILQIFFSLKLQLDNDDPLHDEIFVKKIRLSDFGIYLKKMNDLLQLLSIAK